MTITSADMTFTDRDFVELVSTVSAQGRDIANLKDAMNEVRMHMERHSTLLWRILLAILATGGTMVVLLVVFILEHVHG